MSGYQEDLATQDWLDANPRFSTYDALFDRIVDLIENAAYVGIFFARFSYPSVIQSADATFESRYFENFSRAEAETILISYVNPPNQPTEADYLALLQIGQELAQEFNSIASEFELSDDSIMTQDDVALGDAYATADGLISYGEGYEDRRVLDDLRAIIFDPAFNPTTELSQLETLRSLITEMPTQILGVDVSFVKTGMEAYADMLQAQIDWRNQMRIELTRVDQEMIRRQTQGIPWQNLWWLAEFSLAVLFEPLDWLITFRDIASGIYHGDLSAWDFLGFLPILTNNLGRIARLMARSDVDELVEAGLQRSDDLSKAAQETNNTLLDGYPYGSAPEGQIDPQNFGITKTVDPSQAYLPGQYGFLPDNINQEYTEYARQILELSKNDPRFIGREISIAGDANANVFFGYVGTRNTTANTTIGHAINMHTHPPQNLQFALANWAFGDTLPYVPPSRQDFVGPLKGNTRQFWVVTSLPDGQDVAYVITRNSDRFGIIPSSVVDEGDINSAIENFAERYGRLINTNTSQIEMEYVDNWKKAMEDWNNNPDVDMPILNVPSDSAIGQFEAETTGGIRALQQLASEFGFSF